MMFLPFILLAATTSCFAVPHTLQKRAAPLGIDISHFQGAVNFNIAKANGISFVYIKATEGTTFIDPQFSTNYIAATNAGLIRGAYHFAHPDSSSGATQANYFLAHGGGWSSDGITLPGALDIEYNPNGAECYGLSASAMVSWIRDFSNTYHSATEAFPGEHLEGFDLVPKVKCHLVIYTTTDWWTTCTGNSAAFGSTNPLWIARYASSIGTLPAGWSFTTFWQYADSGPNPGDQD